VPVRWLAGLLLLLSTACEAASAMPSAQPTPAVWWHSGDPPPAVAKAPPAGVTAPIEDPINAWSTPRRDVAADAPIEERLLAILRRNLRRRGLSPELLAGPTAVVPTRDHPDAELAIEGAEATELAASWPQGAALILTGAGRWWVWEYGSTAPADALARQLQAQAGTRGL
jgi:hypothetical protein